MMTTYRQAKQNLEALFKDIVLNPMLIRALRGQPKAPSDDAGFYALCQLFVTYQQTLCANNGLSFNTEGFVVGSPWHGDPMNAAVMFLAGNPGITPKCLFPRWHDDRGAGFFTLGGLGAPATLTADNGDTYSNNITLEEAREFMEDRFQTTRMNDDTGVLNIWSTENNPMTGRPGGVQFWNYICHTAKDLLNNPIAGETPGQYTRRTMRKVLSAEVIPFGTQNQGPLAPALQNDKDYCFNRFVVPLLESSAVRVIFLVGSIAIDTFASVTGINIPSGTVSQATFPFTNRNGENFTVAAMDPPPHNGAPVYPVPAVPALLGLGAALPPL